jgi:pSer/pThr/pTyr-binding forkhead associated (FHA) protein
MQLRLTWDDPISGEKRSLNLTPPVALGREFARMPVNLGPRTVAQVLLDSAQVSRYHALIEATGEEVFLLDQGSINGSRVNGSAAEPQVPTRLSNGDSLQIGPYSISVGLGVAIATIAIPKASPTILFNAETDVLEANPTPQSPPPGQPFPPECFSQLLVSLSALRGLAVEEVDYLALGGGLGSFIWTDLLRLGGVRPSQIVALGIEPKPYARYQRLCLNSQIPPHERLRSNSDSCPDNIWGFPSYAWREAVRDCAKFRIGSALHHLWQVFGEPTLAETYTPRAGNVFASIDREAARIGWDQIYRYGRIRSIRKTDDGRYVVAYSRGRGDHALLVARYVHLALGYPAIQFLPDLQAYRESTQDFQTVVNAYEPHEQVYAHLERNGGTVLLRGRGIVASRVVQRLHEARQRNAQISVMHLMRSPRPQGHRYNKAIRAVRNHYELQPFNWPKACWSGTLRSTLEAASPEQRQRLLADWGGTTTADRRDWQHIATSGIAQGWYQIVFGEVGRVDPHPAGGTVTMIQEKGRNSQIQLQADFIIDATGLDAKVDTNPVLADLVAHYQLPLNSLGRLTVANDFELPEMQSGPGKLYAAGAATLGGPYAAVDSFLGLQYAALVSVDSLVKAKAPRLRPIQGVRSLLQWCRWAIGATP